MLDKFEFSITAYVEVHQQHALLKRKDDCYFPQTASQQTLISAHRQMETTFSKDCFEHSIRSWINLFLILLNFWVKQFLNSCGLFMLMLVFSFRGEKYMGSYYCNFSKMRELMSYVCFLSYLLSWQSVHRQNSLSNTYQDSVQILKIYMTPVSEFDSNVVLTTVLTIHLSNRWDHTLILLQVLLRSSEKQFFNLKY